MKWVCPYCHQKSDPEIARTREEGYVRYEHAQRAYVLSTQCTNPDCGRMQIDVEIWTTKPGLYANSRDADKFVSSFRLIPASRAAALPDYVPDFVREDYEEACKTETASPKASAALSRRCLQNIIRDFWTISKNTLNAEIEALESEVSDEIRAALHALRKIGNFAAHPERDPAVIVDIEPGAATAMIDLLEVLISETYVARARREARIKRVSEIAGEKEAAAKLSP